MRKVVVGVALFVGLASLAAWTVFKPNTREEALSPQPPDPALAGRFYATAGPGDTEADLYNLRFVPGLVMFTLTNGHRTFGVDGCAEALTIGVAGPEVNFQDALRRFDGQISPIDGLGDGAGALAAVGSDCRTVFLRLDRSASPPTNHLMLFDPASQSLREIYAPGPGKVLGVSDWGPDGQIAVFEGTAPADGQPTVVTGIVLISENGSKRTLPPPVSALGTLQWGASRWIAVSDESRGATVFLDPDSGARSELPGWTPLAWSPDGQRLMVTDASERKVLAVVDDSNLGAARVVGRAEKVAFVDLVWLTDDATAGGPLPVGRRADDGDGA
jgi:hypothetical protein